MEILYTKKRMWGREDISLLNEDIMKVILDYVEVVSGNRGMRKRKSLTRKDIDYIERIQKMGELNFIEINKNLLV